MNSKTHYRVTIETIGNPHDESTTRAGDTLADALAGAMQDHGERIGHNEFRLLADVVLQMAQFYSHPDDCNDFVSAAEKIVKPY